VKVIVHIERVVLEGFAKAGDLDRLRAALETELSEALATPARRGAPASSASDLRPVVLRRVDLGAGPETLGRGIAQAALTRMGPARDAIARVGRRAATRAPEAAP
jgi:hypothetical protein